MSSENSFEIWHGDAHLGVDSDESVNGNLDRQRRSSTDSSISESEYADALDEVVEHPDEPEGVVFGVLNNTAEGNQESPYLTEEEDENEAPQAKRGRKGVTVMTADFETDEELTKLKQDNSLMSNGKQKFTKNGMRQPFVCIQKKLKCPVSATAIFGEPVNRLEVRNKHNHPVEGRQRTNGISNEVKDIVRERLKTGESLSALVIRTVLRARGFSEDNIPSVEKIRNFTSYEKKKLYGGIFSCADFERMCTENMILDDDPDEKVGILAYDMKIVDGEPQFYNIMTSRKLLNRIRSQRHIQTDGTYKLLYFCHPVVVIGFTDERHTFNPVAICIVSDESGPTYQKLLHHVRGDSTFLEGVADGAAAISFAFSRELPQTMRRMCYYHFKESVKRAFVRLKLPDDIITLIQNDIKVIAKCTSIETAKAAANHIVASWREEEDAIPFADYFDTEWVEKLPYWMNVEGGGPRTNNNQESKNGILKMYYTFRRRLSVPESFAHFRNFLTEYQSKKVKKFKPKEEEHFKPARMLYEEKRFVATVGERFFIPTRDSLITQAEAAELITQYTSANPSFDAILQFQRELHMISPSKLYPGRMWCSCHAFLKPHTCKHSLMFEVHSGVRTWPSRIRHHTTALGGVRGPGRGRTARHALSRN
uniref:MULE domain-containing protein n=1 Tax=Panagrellus redivivus TaxID=6233 RepID=A0A7E4ZY45_PANRE